jgi:hypothetical protein
MALDSGLAYTAPPSAGGHNDGFDFWHGLKQEWPVAVEVGLLGP